MDYEMIVPLLFSISHFTGCSHAQCPLGNYGSTCELKCGQCAGDGSCYQITGSCVGGCNPGYTGSKCDGACPSTCGGDGSCFQYPPYCRNGCQAGYTGLRCDQVTISTCPLNCLEPCGTYDCPSGCLPGYYGFDCSVRCSCSSGVACEQISGVCEITTHKSSPSVLTKSLSFYTTAFWVPVALLSLVMAMGCIRTIWKLYARKRKNSISSYESRFVLSEEINVAYDRLNEPDNIYIELERMPTITSFSDNRGGSQYYSTVASLRDHAKFRSDNRALADQVILEEGVIPDGQPQRVSEAHSYLYLIP
uniref:Angiopoietin-1 receptor n=1 Tax=Magallana gigas TaxID=29159 RepID=K1QVK2_MAGGI